MARERHKVVAVGLTGGIGAGKSTALAFFGELGAITVSADAIVHELYSRQEIANQVAARFGAAVLGAEGGVDRTRLAEAIRGRRRDLRWLEELTHPVVSEALVDVVNEAPPGSIVVCEVPLLFEAGFEDLFDLIVTIEASPQTRRQRSVHEFGLGQFAEFERLQAASERRVAGSDLACFNDGDLVALGDFVRSAYDRAAALVGEER